MKLLIPFIFNIIVLLNTNLYAHDNLEQHAIAHVYPFLDSEYMNDENNNCKMGILKSLNCSNNSDKDKNKNSTKK